MQWRLWGCCWAVCLDSRDLQVPAVLLASDCLEQGPMEQLKFRSESHGDLVIQKSAIEHLFRGGGGVWGVVGKVPQLCTFEFWWC